MVSGKNGQLGTELRKIANEFPEFEFIFFDRATLDITSQEMLENAFSSFKPSYFINAAAFTAADQCEIEKEKCFEVNGKAAENIAKACYRYGTKFIHISSDYVFGGESHTPYKETDATNPLNNYGLAKVEGEKMAFATCPNTIVLRISWVYSEFGKNFVKTMLRLMNEKDSFGVVNDRVGSPTYARDVAELILHIIKNDYSEKISFQPGIYHFSNEGIISWFDFAVAIRDFSGLNCTINPISSDEYIAPADRPAYSALNCEKIQTVYDVKLKNWKDRLKVCISLIHK